MSAVPDTVRIDYKVPRRRHPVVAFVLQQPLGTAGILVIAAMIFAGFSLFEAVLAFFQFPGAGLGFAMAIMPALILWYLSSAEIKEAFGEGDVTGV